VLFAFWSIAIWNGASIPSNTTLYMHPDGMSHSSSACHVLPWPALQLLRVFVTLPCYLGYLMCHRKSWSEGVWWILGGSVALICPSSLAFLAFSSTSPSTFRMTYRPSFSLSCLALSCPSICPSHILVDAAVTSW
jgi:hypothetical protein